MGYVAIMCNLCLSNEKNIAAINMSLAFCMGGDLLTLISSEQPMAAIFFNSFGHKPTLVIWSFVVLVQYMMGSSFVRIIS